MIYPTASASLGRVHALSCWMRATVQTYVHAKLSVPGVGDEIDRALTVGTSWRRYVVQGPTGVVSGNIAGVLLFADGSTVDVAGVKIEAGGVTPYTHTNFGATLSAQAGDDFTSARRPRRVRVLADILTFVIDSAAGDYFVLSVLGARTIGAPTNAVPGASFTIDLANASGGAIVTTFNAIFKLAGAWVDPAAGKRRKLTVTYDGTNWVEDGRSAGDI
jgi:hypothetical protein